VILVLLASKLLAGLCFPAWHLPTWATLCVIFTLLSIGLLVGIIDKRRQASSLLNVDAITTPPLKVEGQPPAEAKATQFIGGITSPTTSEAGGGHSC
jgi:hypothetical protein